MWSKCDDPLESASLFDKMVQLVNKIGYTMYRLISLRLLSARFGELRKLSARIKLMFAYLKHSS